MTYLLRKYYYGVNDSRTLQSFHNTGAYLLKYAEYCYRGEIIDATLDLNKAFESVQDIFAKAAQKRKDHLAKQQRIDENKYFLELKKTSSDRKLGFMKIYSEEEIKDCYNGELAECSDAVLESLQYQSYACYMMSLVQEDQEKKATLLKKAIQLSDKVTLARSIVLGPCHRKTLESMRYSAEYYFAAGSIDKAKLRICYAVDHLKIGQVSTEQYEEYVELRKKITGEK